MAKKKNKLTEQQMADMIEWATTFDVDEKTSTLPEQRKMNHSRTSIKTAKPFLSTNKFQGHSKKG